MATPTFCRSDTPRAVDAFSDPPKIENGAIGIGAMFADETLTSLCGWVDEDDEGLFEIRAHVCTMCLGRATHTQGNATVPVSAGIGFVASDHV